MENNGLIVNQLAPLEIKPPHPATAVQPYLLSLQHTTVHVELLQMSYPYPGRNHAQASTPEGVNTGGYPHN